MRLALIGFALLAETACGGLAAFNSQARTGGSGDSDGDTPIFDTSDTNDTVDTRDTTPDCPDHDNDGVCDVDDLCHGSDDNADADNDGNPDDCDDCPNDRNDDSDGDGSCDSDDVCPGSNDNQDADHDGVPNGCDDCPNDALNDGDGDGVCDGVDSCPGDPTNTCTHTIRLTVTTDLWPYESSWEFYDAARNLVDSDYPPGSNTTYTYDYNAQVGASGCIDVYDTYGDGGMPGSVRDLTTGSQLTSWGEFQYAYFGEYCFTVNP
jgi:YD repeat-containing protein